MSNPSKIAKQLVASIRSITVKIKTIKTIILHCRYFNEVWEGFRALDMDQDVRISLTDLHKVESVTSNQSLPIFHTNKSNIYSERLTLQKTDTLSFRNSLRLMPLLWPLVYKRKGWGRRMINFLGKIRSEFPRYTNFNCICLYGKNRLFLAME